MSPVKSALFFVYCLAGIVALGASFSNFWKTRAEWAHELEPHPLQHSSSIIILKSYTTP